MSIERMCEELGCGPAARGEAIDNLTRITEALFERLKELEQKQKEKDDAAS